MSRQICKRNAKRLKLKFYFNLLKCKMAGSKSWKRFNVISYNHAKWYTFCHLIRPTIWLADGNLEWTPNYYYLSLSLNDTMLFIIIRNFQNCLESNSNVKFEMDANDTKHATIDSIMRNDFQFISVCNVLCVINI